MVLDIEDLVGIEVLVQVQLAWVTGGCQQDCETLDS